MIKKKILVVIACLFITSFGIAQNEIIDNREDVTFALKAGLNYSNVYNTQSENFRADGKFGFAGGVALTIPLNLYFGIHPEVLLSQKGFKGDGIFLGTNYDFTRTSTFIDIPLLIAFKPAATISILAGPQYSYLIKQKDVFNSAFINTVHEQEFENENIRNNIFGVVAGIDINLNHFVIGTRFGWDLMDNHSDGSSNTPRYRNAWVQATIGYIFYN